MTLMMTGSKLSLKVKGNKFKLKNLKKNRNVLESGESGASYGFSAITIFHAVIENRQFKSSAFKRQFN